MAPSLPSTYKAAVLPAVNAALSFQEVPLTHPGPNEILVKVLACAVCFSDHALQTGHLGDVFPRIPGHEVVGDVVEVGSAVTGFRVGERVGGGWHGGHDGTCKACRRGLYQMCGHRVVRGVTADGGYAQYALMRAEAVAGVPPDMDPAQAAPLLCAGVTTFNAIRRLGVPAGALLAVQGLGGLGHLAVQFASRMGYHVVALSSGDAKRKFAAGLGAMAYIDTSTEDAVKRLNEMGGADVVVCTAPSAKAISPLVGGLAAGGKMLILSAAGPVEFDSGMLLTRGISVHGWPSGHALDWEEAIEFARRKGVECMIEKFKFEDASAAMEHMIAGKARFKCVLVME